MPPGGAKRKKTDEVDYEHLQDTLMEVVRKNGGEQAFQFGGYENLQKGQAVLGKDLAAQLELLQGLHKVSSNLLLKYIDLKEAFTRVLSHYPTLKARWPVQEQPFLAGKLSEYLITVCTHARGIANPRKFQEACNGLPDFYVAKLKQVQALVMSERPEATPKKAKASPSKPDKRPSWDEVMDMEIPAQQPSTSEGENEAQAVSPVPPRKQTLKASMKKPAASLQGAAKKPAGKKAGKKAWCHEKGWHLMNYKDTNETVAIREKGGKQVVCIGFFKSRKKNTKACMALLKLLEGGKSYEGVKAEKAKLQP